MKNIYARVFIAAALVIVFIAASSATIRAEDFYKGKTVRVIVGYAPGGGYDTYTRAIARYLGNIFRAIPPS